MEEVVLVTGVKCTHHFACIRSWKEDCTHKAYTCLCVHNVCAKEVMLNANGVESVVLEPNTSALCVKKAASPDCFFCVQDGQWVG